MKISELNYAKIRTMILDRAYYYPRRMRRIFLGIATFVIKKYKIRYKDVEIVVHVSTNSDLDRARGGYEKFVVDQIYDSLCVDNNEIVYYEIGACIGINSLIVSKMVRDKKGTCVAFEPSPANFDTIAKSVLENDIKNIILIPFAISNESNLSKLYLAKPKISSGQGGHSLRYLDYHKESHFIRVPKMSLDDAIKILELPVPTFISLDVESHEEEVLEGMEELLSYPKLKNIIIEINGTRDPHGSKVTDILKKAGYYIKDYKASEPRAVVHCVVNYEKTEN